MNTSHHHYGLKFFSGSNGLGGIAAATLLQLHPAHRAGVIGVGGLWLYQFEPCAGRRPQGGRQTFANSQQFPSLFKRAKFCCKFCFQCLQCFH